MQLENLLTIPEAAESEGVSRTSIYNWISAGVLPFIQKGAQRLIRPEALETASIMMATKKTGVKLRRKNRNLFDKNTKGRE